MIRIFTLIIISFSITASIAQESTFKFNEHLLESNFERSSFSIAKDMDFDGDIDIVSNAYGDGKIFWFENDGSQNFTKQIVTNDFPGAWDMVVLDYDNDGDIDIICYSFSNVEHSIFENDGNQNFTEISMVNKFGSAVVFPINFNEDGKTDFVADNFYNNNTTSNVLPTQINWFENDGSSNFINRTTSINIPNVITATKYTDLDRDGDADFIIKDTLLNEYYFLKNINGQSFEKSSNSISFSLDSGSAIDYTEDVDNDGDIDLLVNNISLNQMYWYENDGNHNYTKHVIDSNIDYPFQVVSEDFDKDGDMDIIASAYDEHHVFIYLNDGNQNFIKSQTIYVYGALDIEVVDLDKDDDLDLIITGYDGDNITWFENTAKSLNISDQLYKKPNLGDHNYVYTIAPQVEVTSTDNIVLNKEAIESVAYFDGLGRPIQNVGIRAGGKGEDIITPITYDDFGRQNIDYLPYADGSNIGEKFRPNVETLLSNFYNNKYGDDFMGLSEADRNPYSEKHFEASPLNRVLEQGAPGADWKVDKDNDTDHTIKFDYQSNGLEEARLFEVTFTNGNTEEPSLSLSTANNGFYSANELYKTVTKDENWQPGQTNPNDHTTEEFKDKQGMVVLKRTYNQNAKHDTYYVYDDFGNLTYVLPPKMDGSSALLSIINSQLNDLGYQYKYDYRNRLIHKKIPGKGWENIVYDNLDRPVLTQDANQALNNEWLFTKYDVLGRVIYTGKVTESATLTTIRANFKNKSANQNYETKGSSGLSIGYTNANFPNTNLTVLTINYYDDYTLGGAPFIPTLNGTQVFDDYIDVNTKSLATVSKVKVLETTDDWVTTVTYYDKKARPIYIHSTNDFLNTTDIIQTDLDFVGKILKTRTSHKKGSDPELVTLDTFTYDQSGRLLRQIQCIGGTDLEDTCGNSGADDIQSTLVTTEAISPGTTKAIVASQSVVLKPGFHAKPAAGQSVEIKIGTGGSISGSQVELIAENTYDELGQLTHKKVGNAESTPLQNIGYTYNIRGWLKNINDDAENDDDLFNFGIMYNTPTSGIALYNGNISQTSWSSSSVNSTGNPLSNQYTYGYDALNRITAASGANTSNYDLNSVAYDKNGNITSLNRKGHTNLGATSFGTMDNLSYDYGTANGNKLLGVTDTGETTTGFKDGTNTGDDFTYDTNGNLLTDANKGITSILYNHLNLPTEVKFDNSNTKKINYTYDATGIKLRKVVNDNSVITTTDYAGNGSVYENNTLQFIPQPEGYITPDGSGGYSYVYNYTDHLGSIRLSYTDANKNGSIDPATEIIEENSYYPYGLKMRGFNSNTSSLGNSLAQRYKFNGKEFDESFNQTLNTYDFGARNYDPALGRWMNLDPLAEQMRRHSPYNFAFNNPIYFIDPDGMAPVYNWGAERYEDEDGNEVSWESVKKEYGIGSSSGGGEDPPENGVAKMMRRVKNSIAHFFGFDTKEAVQEVEEAYASGNQKEIDGALDYLDESTGNLKNTVDKAKDFAEILATSDFTGITGVYYEYTLGNSNTDKVLSVLALIPFGKLAKGAKLIKFTQAGKRMETLLPAGFKLVKGQYSHGQKIYSNGKYFISPDGTGHSGGMWKAAKKINQIHTKKSRLGTFDANFIKIGE